VAMKEFRQRALGINELKFFEGRKEKLDFRM
jgi:hypothetical protein